MESVSERWFVQASAFCVSKVGQLCSHALSICLGQLSVIQHYELKDFFSSPGPRSLPFDDFPSILNDPTDRRDEKSERAPMDGKKVSLLIPGMEVRRWPFQRQDLFVRRFETFMKRPALRKSSSHHVFLSHLQSLFSWRTTRRASCSPTSPPNPSSRTPRRT